MFPERVQSEARDRIGTLVFPEGGDKRVVEAADRLIRDGIAKKIILVDPEADLDQPEVEVVDSTDYARRDQVRSILENNLEDLSADEIDELAADPLHIGAALVELGDANGMVAGAAHPTADVLRSALGCIGTREGEDVVSSSFVMELDQPDFGTDGKLIFSDPAVLPDPDEKQLQDVAAGAVRTYENLVEGDEEPRVAFLSFSTKGSARHENVDKVREATEGFREKYPGVLADGELQVDAAIVPSVADRKAPDSPIEGDANILVFPDLDAANIGYKLVQWLGDAGAYGPFLQGLDGVVNDLSRGCSVDDIITVSAVSVIQGTS